MVLTPCLYVDMVRDERSGRPWNSIDMWSDAADAEARVVAMVPVLVVLLIEYTNSVLGGLWSGPGAVTAAVNREI